MPATGAAPDTPAVPAPADAGVEANARLTGAIAAALLVLLAAEGATVVSVRSLLTPHVFLGMLLLPPVAVKLGSTSWRFLRYYRHAPAYRRKGPPPPILRALGPFLVIVTITLFASGVVVLYAPGSWRSQWLFVHKVSFIAWFATMAIHVVGHLRETARLAPRDWVRRSRTGLAGYRTRRTVLITSLAVGLLVALATVGQVSSYHPGGHRDHGGRTTERPPGP